MTERVALVTGGARRIGAAIVKRLHEAGFRVLIHCHRSQQEAIALMDSLNRIKRESATYRVSDLAIPSVDIVQQALDWAGRLDVLVNNASLFSRDAADWEQLFQVNVKAPFVLSEAAYPHLNKVQGCIVNITDIHASLPLKGYAVYCQSKAALLMQTKALAREYAPNVRVNAVAPGAILWPEAENSLSSDQQQALIAKTPLKRHGDPLYIAEATLSLVNQPFITGQSLAVDGGRLLL